MPNAALLLSDTKPLPAPPPRPTDSKFVSATVSRIVDGAVYVTIKEFRGTYDWGPVEAPSSWAPAVGEACGLAFDQRNVAYVVWVP